MGKKIKFFFLIYDEKSAENFILGIHLVEKCLIRRVLTNFCTNVPFWGPKWPSNYFSYLPLDLSRQDASFKPSYDYFWEMIFFDQKKWQNCSKLKNFVRIVLITHFFLRVHILIFLIWWIFWKLEFFGLFSGFSNGTLNVTPLESTGKNCSTMVLWYIKK